MAPRKGRPRRRPAFHRPRLEALEDRALPSAYVVTTTADWNPQDPMLPQGYRIPGSLRDAINAVNADVNHALYASPSNPSVDEIDFKITTDSDTGGGYGAATGAFTIRPLTSLPGIATSVILDGYTQPGASPNMLKGVGPLGVAPGDPSQYGDNAVLKVVLDGSLVPKSNGNDSAGLVLGAPNCIVQGLVINNWSRSVWVEGDGDIVRGNFIGTDVTGTDTYPNTYGDYTTPEIGVDVSSNNVRVGGPTPQDRNVIAGFWSAGINDSSYLISASASC
jgi:hypothetical protein